MSNEALITQLIESNQEAVKACATACEQVKNLSERFDKLEKRVFGPDGVNDDVDKIKEKFSYARGWLAGWACAIGLGSAAATAMVMTLLKKVGWIS